MQPPGIRTLPACLGEKVTKKVLILILLGLHGVMLYALFAGIIGDEWIVLLFGLALTIAFLMVYSSSFEHKSQIYYRKLEGVGYQLGICLFPGTPGMYSRLINGLYFFPTASGITRQMRSPHARAEGSRLITSFLESNTPLL